MNNCEYCDYYKNIGGNGIKDNYATAVCTFADVILFKEYFESQGVEYPCRHITYQQYLDRKKTTVSVSKLKPEDWKLTYKSKHPVGETIRSRNAL